MIERLYYLLLMSGGKMIRRIRAAPSTLLSVIGRLTRGAVSAMESITQTRVSIKGELVSQEYRYTAVAKMQIHAMAIATTAMEKLKGAVKTALAVTAIATIMVGKLEGTTKTALKATALTTLARLKAISGQSYNSFRGRGNADILWIKKLEAITASAFHVVGSAITEAFISAIGQSRAAFATNTVAMLISVVTVPGYLQMAAVAIGNLAQVNAPVSAAAFVATMAIGILNSHSTTVLTGRAYARILARGSLLDSIKTLYGYGSTIADINVQANLLTGRMADSQTSVAMSAQGLANAHPTQRGQTDTKISTTGQAIINANKRGRAKAFISVIGEVLRTEASQSRLKTVVSATANPTIAQNTASDTKIGIMMQGPLSVAILHYISATANAATEVIGNTMVAIKRLAGHGATAVLSVGQVMMQNYRGWASTIISVVGQITLYPGQWISGKIKTKVSSSGALTAGVTRTPQSRVKAIITTIANVITSSTQRAFIITILLAQGIGTVFFGVIQSTINTSISATAKAILAAISRGTVQSIFFATANATLDATTKGMAQNSFSATATMTHQVLLLRGSTFTVGSAIGSASINSWKYPVYNDETQDLYIEQAVSANQNGNRLTVT